MNCKLCAAKCIKAGKQTNGRQKYYCKRCKKYQQSTYRYAAYSIKDKRDFFISLYNEGNGVRSMSRILRVSCNTVMKWKQEFADKIKKPSYYSSGHIYEIDEMYSFVGSKNQQVWIMYVFDRTAKRVLDFRVGSRSKKNMKFLID